MVSKILKTTEKAKRLGREFITGVFCNIPDDINQGLTKREYFAAVALNGLLIGYATEIEIDFKLAAKKSVILADVLLEELAKQSENE